METVDAIADMDAELAQLLTEHNALVAKLSVKMAKLADQQRGEADLFKAVTDLTARAVLAQALFRARGSASEAARRLGMNRGTFRRWAKELGLHKANDAGCRL